MARESEAAGIEQALEMHHTLATAFAPATFSYRGRHGRRFVVYMAGTVVELNTQQAVLAVRAPRAGRDLGRALALQEDEPDEPTD